jgi:hypothetical protein
MQDHIFFRHFDFRPQQQHRRITKEEHIKAAKEARELNLNKKNRESTKVHGFYDVWVFDRLPYSDLPQNTTPPIDHAVGGAVHRMCDYMFGVYKEKPVTRKKKKKKQDPLDVETTSKQKASETSKKQKENDEKKRKEEERLPIYRPSYTDVRQPYSCSAANYDFGNAALQCVLIPFGVNHNHSSYKINLKQMGYIKLDEFKKLVSVYWDFLLSILDINIAFQRLFRMMGCFLSDLLAWKILKTDVDKLQKRIIEILSLWESMLPPKESFFQTHQLMDLPSSISLFGKIPTELQYERALGDLKTIKKKSNSGGAAYEGMIIERHVNRELRILKSFYSTAINLTKASAPNHKSKVSYDKVNKILYNRNFCFEIWQPELFTKNKVQEPLQEQEINHLVKMIRIEIHKAISW